MDYAYKNTVFFFKSQNPSLNCLKVFNKDGDELSLSGDDSCGAFEHLSRISLAIFRSGGHEMVGGEVFHVTPEELLRNLAGHLGYTVTKI